MRISAFVLPAGWGISHFQVREKLGRGNRPSLPCRAKHVLFPPAIYKMDDHKKVINFKSFFGSYLNAKVEFSRTYIRRVSSKRRII